MFLLMDRRAEPELMNTKDQVDSYSEADFSKGEIKFIQLIKNYLKKNNIHPVSYTHLTLPTILLV